MAQPTDFQLFKWFIWHYKEVPIISTGVFGTCVAIALYHGSQSMAVFFSSLLFGIIPTSFFVFRGQKKSINILYQYEQERKAILGERR